IIDPEYHYEAINVEAQQNNPHSLLWWMKRILTQRKQSKALGRGSVEFLYPENRRILAFIRRYEDEQVLVVANLSRFAQGTEIDLSRFAGSRPLEMFGKTQFPAITERPYFISLGPHAFYWFLLQPQAEPHEVLRFGADAPVIAIESWDDVFAGRTRDAINRLMPRFLPERRWFRGRGRNIRHTNIRDVIRFRKSESYVILVQV